MGTLDPSARPPTVTGRTWTFAARIARIVDADTIVVDCLVDVGWEEMLTRRRTIRLEGVDAPEDETPAGAAAERYVADLLPVGTAIVVDVIKYDKYGGRDVGRINVGGVDLADQLVIAGHARRI